jgi:hypothetical protein
MLVQVADCLQPPQTWEQGSICEGAKQEASTELYFGVQCHTHCDETQYWEETKGPYI